MAGVLCALMILLAGCGGSNGDTPELGNVRGTVTLDGAPLAGAQISFQPVAGGRPSTGTTGDDGTYSLSFSNDQSGAKVGEHTVSITTFTYAKPDAPEKLPAKYNTATTLTASVQPKNEPVDFNLQSK